MIGRIASGETVPETEVGGIAFAANKTRSDVDDDSKAVAARLKCRSFDEFIQTLPRPALFEKFRELRSLLNCSDDDVRHAEPLHSGVSHSKVREQIAETEAIIKDPVRGYFWTQDAA
jgi:hypothetical protein